MHLLLLLHHLRALSELRRRLVEVVRMLQLVNRRRLVLNMVAGRRLLHVPLLLRRPLLRLLWDVRMLRLVASLVVERHSTPVPHARVAAGWGFSKVYCYVNKFTSNYAWQD